MCDACFNEEIRSFPTTDDYDEFDLILTKKIANDKSMRMRQYVHTGWKDLGYQVYECFICGQLWQLKTIDKSERLCFLRITQQKINSDSSPL